MTPPTELVVFALLAAFYFLARLYPIWPRRFQGCDAYNIMLCAKILRHEHRLPIRLPEKLFLLEETEQWYPPLFLVLCALLPEKWLERRYWLINHAVDLGTLAVLFWVATTIGPLWAAAGVGTIYAFSTGTMHEYASLNVRPLGGLLLCGFLIAAYHGLATHSGWIGLACLLGILLLYAHKLSAQQLWFTLPFLAVVTMDWRWVALLPAIYGLAFLVWPRGFTRILAAQKAIVVFWHRNHRLLGAHAVRQSPIYGDAKTRTEVYAKDGIVGFLVFAKNALHQNYFILPLAAIATLRSTVDPMAIFLLGWVVSVYLWAGLVHGVPWLRGIGLGIQYVKFAFVPTLLFLVKTISGSGEIWMWLLTLLAVGLTARQYALTARGLRTTTGGQMGAWSGALGSLLARIKTDPKARVMCLPVYLCDLVACKTGQSTYWGTHSHCFDERLEQFFPVLKQPLGEYAKKAGLTHLLLDHSYATPTELHLSKDDFVEEQGQYGLYRLHERSGLPHTQLRVADVQESIH